MKCCTGLIEKEQIEDLQKVIRLLEQKRQAIKRGILKGNLVVLEEDIAGKKKVLFSLEKQNRNNTRCHEDLKEL